MEAEKKARSASVLKAEQVADGRKRDNPRWHFGQETESRAAIDLIASGHFSRGESGIFKPLIVEGHMELRELRNVFQRSCHRRISIRHFGSGTLPRPVTA